MINSGITISPTPYREDELVRAWTEIKEALPEEESPYLNVQENFLLTKHIRHVTPEELTKKFYNDSALLILIEQTCQVYIERIFDGLNKEKRIFYADWKKELTSNLLFRPSGQGRVIKLSQYLSLAKNNRPSKCSYHVKPAQTKTLNLNQISECPLKKDEVLLIARTLLEGLKNIHAEGQYFHLLTELSIQIRIDKDGEFIDVTLTGAYIENQHLLRLNIGMALVILVNLFNRQGLDSSFINRYVERKNLDTFLIRQTIAELPYFIDDILKETPLLEFLYEDVVEALSKPVHTLENSLRYTPFNEFPFIKRDVPKVPGSLFAVFNEIQKMLGRKRLNTDFLRAHIATFSKDTEREVEGGYEMPDLNNLLQLSTLFNIRCDVYKDQKVIYSTLESKLDIPFFAIEFDGTYFDLLIPERSE